MCFIGSPGPKVKPNTIKLVFVASPLNTQHQGERTKARLAWNQENASQWGDMSITVVKHVCPINDTHCKVIFLQISTLRSVVTVISFVLVLKSQSIRTLRRKNKGKVGLESGKCVSVGRHVYPQTGASVN
jgi:hypothetical protein